MLMEIKRKQGYLYLCQLQQTLSQKVTRDKDHYIMIEGSTYQDDLTVNIYVPNIETSKYVKQILIDLKGGITIQ